MNRETKTEEYQSDETKLYQDWYLGQSQIEGEQYTTQVAVIPELDELKILFEQWLNKHQNALKKVCDEYSQIKQQWQNQEPLLIAALADILSALLGGVPVNVVATATILVTEKFLDRLCDYSKSDKE